MKILSAVVGFVLFIALGVKAEATNVLSDAEVQGQILVRKILAQLPVENFTNTGKLIVRNNAGRFEYPIQFETIVTATNWSGVYRLINPTNSSHVPKTLTVLHDQSNSNRYEMLFDLGDGIRWAKDGQAVLKMFPFAGDFGCADLGLEFFRWPTQKVLKKEIHRSCACTVLESINPNLTSGVYSNGYSRVVSWIDNDSLGVVEAYAYDFNGKKLKNFYPKDIKKVNGQWQVQTLVMENLQTGSKSRIEFDLKR